MITMQSLGVDWSLPKKDGEGFSSRRFASTTVASAELVRMLAEDGLTWSEAVSAILYDPEAQAVCIRFVSEGYGDMLMSEFVS